VYHDVHLVLVATKLLTAKLHSCHAKVSESGAGVGNFGKAGVGVGHFWKARVGFEHFTSDSATMAARRGQRNFGRAV